MLRLQPPRPTWPRSWRMRSDRARQRRAALIERIRLVEQRQRAADAHAAEQVRARLHGISLRSAGLAQDYARLDMARDGQELHDLALMRAELRAMTANARSDAERAEEQADRRLQDLAVAEKRLDAARDQSRAVAQDLARRQQAMPDAQARRNGTPLE